jgi:hypothetical protein
VNKQEILKVAEKIALMNTIYGTNMSNEAVYYQAQLLSDLEFQPVIQAFDQYAKENKTNRPPTPAHIREKVMPPTDARDVGRLEVMRVREAVTKFGWPNPKEAEDYIGPTGWKLVQRSGGWQHICENLGVNISESTFIAQGRDLIETEIKLGRVGYDTDKPLLEQSQKQEQLDNFVKKLAMTKKLE